MILPDAVERFGLLSEAVQVKGAIALDQISRIGMFLDAGRVESVRSGLRARIDALVVELTSMPACQGLFRADREGRPVLTDGGVPSKSNGRLVEILRHVADDVAGDLGHPIVIPRTPKGEVSTSTKAWEDYAPFHSFLRAWIDLERTAKLNQFFAKLAGSLVRPRYAPLVRTGRTSCTGPNIQQIPRKGGFREAFVPRPGHLFLILDYGFIELRTLAAECEARYGTSMLANVIRAGVDPHCYTAAMFEGMSLEEFMLLKESDRAEDRDLFDLLRQRAKVLNFGIPGGLGAASLVAYAKSTYGVTLTLEEASEFRRRLIEEVYPELSLYLSDDGMETLARNLGTSVEACWREFDWKGDRSGKIVGGIHNVVQGKTCKADGQPYSPRFYRGVWDGLVELNRTEELAPELARREGSEELCKRLLRSGVTTLTGRIRGRVSFTQARNTPFQGLAADGAKFALWDLLRAGYRVVAFVHDEVVVELSEEGVDHLAEARRVESILNRAMEKVTGAVPVACEFALARRWSKKAKAVYTPDGRLVPCEIDED